MPRYTDEQVREIRERPLSEVQAYYEDLARHQRPAIERAIANLTGHETLPAAPGALRTRG